MTKKKKKPITGIGYNKTVNTLVGGVIALELIKKM